ncbi:MAG: hypothetical protein M3130_06010 [Actinomycetota bacterium]|nr:hypothetical protein [Actinomycetota bacterium]
MRDSEKENVPGPLRDLMARSQGNDDLALGGASPYTHWVGILFAVAAALLVPWIIYIAVSLPARELSPNYDVAWAGFDVMLFASLACTAALATMRRSQWLGLSAAWASGLLVTDAWFDIVTAPDGRTLFRAFAMAFLVELPLTALCAWLVIHSREIAERRLQSLLRQSRATDQP